jgi:protein-S-isoprenylcysteine O-methyltransferase Ste14
MPQRLDSRLPQPLAMQSANVLLTQPQRAFSDWPRRRGAEVTVTQTKAQAEPKTWRLLVGAAFFTLIEPVAVTALVPWLLLPAHPAIAARAASLFGLAAIVCGALIYLRCAADFIFAGRGTPAPYDPPRFLVERGLYRFTRNPMYVGVVGAVAGEALLFHSRDLAVYALVLFVGFHLRVVYYEERVLRKTFGETFEAYCRRVPRWLWPR